MMSNLSLYRLAAFALCSFACFDASFVRDSLNCIARFSSSSVWQRCVRTSVIRLRWFISEIWAAKNVPTADGVLAL